MAAKKEEKLTTIEENFSQIEKIIENMQEDISLEETFDLYKKGLEMIKDSNDKISKVEKEIEIIEKKMSGDL